jgi:hypothetical protein
MKEEDIKLNFKNQVGGWNDRRRERRNSNKRTGTNGKESEF